MIYDPKYSQKQLPMTSKSQKEYNWNIFMPQTLGLYNNEKKHLPGIALAIGVFKNISYSFQQLSDVTK